MPLESINLASLNQQRRKDETNSTTKNTSSEDEFQATPEELENIKSKMNDPVFVQLMHEYMESLNDPETLKEEEEYLKQVEREAKEGGDYSFEFIFPQPVFVVELCNPTTRHASKAEIEKIKGKNASTQKVVGKETEEVEQTKTEVKSYINFCVSEKVDEFREESTQDKRASNWHVPVSVSEKRLEFYQPVTLQQQNSKVQTKHAESKIITAVDEVDTPLCYVYDAVYHPKTLQLANMSNKFLCFVVEIAVEHINSGYKERNGFEFIRLPSNIITIGKPHNQTVRIKNGKSPFEVDKSQPVLTQPQRINAKNNTINNNKGHKSHVKNTTKTTSSNKTTEKVSTLSSQTSSSSSSTLQIVKKQEELEKVKETQANVEETASQLPQFSITHRGYISMSDAWNEKVSDKRIGVPAELVVKIHFTPMINASALDVQITDDGSAIQIIRTPTQCSFWGLIVLPFTVEQEPISAKLVKREGVLTLTLKVIPPLRSCDHNSNDNQKENEQLDTNTFSNGSCMLTAESVREQLGLTCVKSKHMNEDEVKTESTQHKHLEVNDINTISASSCNDDDTLEVNTSQDKSNADNVETEINTVCVDHSDNNKANCDNNDTDILKDNEQKETPLTASTSESSSETTKNKIPHLTCGDAARNQTMLEKVQAARRARLAAENNNDNIDKPKSVFTNTTNDNSDDNNTTTNANSDSVTISQEETKECEKCVEHSKCNEVKKEEMEELYARQDAWHAAVQEQMQQQEHQKHKIDSMEGEVQNAKEEQEGMEKEQREKDEETRLAQERELTHRIAQQQEMLMRQQEEREVKLRSKMRDLPLSNAFIFSIDEIEDVYT